MSVFVISNSGMGLPEEDFIAIMDAMEAELQKQAESLQPPSAKSDMETDKLNTRHRPRCRKEI